MSKEIDDIDKRLKQILKVLIDIQSCILILQAITANSTVEKRTSDATKSFGLYVSVTITVLASLALYILKATPLVAGIALGALIIIMLVILFGLSSDMKTANKEEKLFKDKIDALLVNSEKELNKLRKEIDNE